MPTLPSRRPDRISRRLSAFGIEFNFPLAQLGLDVPGGLCLCGTSRRKRIGMGEHTDRVYGMQWEVELVLRPGSTLLEERVTLYNAAMCVTATIGGTTPPSRYGTIRASSTRCALSLRTVSPTSIPGRSSSRKRPEPDQESDRWPVSFFVHGSHEPFMGIWNPHTQTGTVHFADYPELPAKKIWTWGVDAAGIAGAPLSLTTTAPMPKCRPGSSAIRRRIRFFSPDKPFASANIGCRCGNGWNLAANKAGWFISMRKAPMFGLV